MITTCVRIWTRKSMGKNGRFWKQKARKPFKVAGFLSISRGRRIAFWCRRRESNSHGSPHCPLKTACLPIPPLRQNLQRPPEGSRSYCTTPLTGIPRKPSNLVSGGFVDRCIRTRHNRWSLFRRILCGHRNCNALRNSLIHRGRGLYGAHHR